MGHVLDTLIVGVSEMLVPGLNGGGGGYSIHFGRQHSSGWNVKVIETGHLIESTSGHNRVPGGNSICGVSNE